MAALPEVFLLARPPLLQRFQHHEEPALVQGRTSTRKSHHGVDRRIFQHNVDVALILSLMDWNEISCAPITRALNASRVLLREEALRHNGVKVNAQTRHQDGDHSGEGLVPQHPLQRVGIGARSRSKTHSLAR